MLNVNVSRKVVIKISAQVLELEINIKNNDPHIRQKLRQLAIRTTEDPILKSTLFVEIPKQAFKIIRQLAHQHSLTYCDATTQLL